MENKYYRIGVHFIALDYDDNTMHLCRNEPNHLELKIHQSREAIENIEDYKMKEEGGHKEEITREEFYSVFSEVSTKMNDWE